MYQSSPGGCHGLYSNRKASALRLVPKRRLRQCHQLREGLGQRSFNEDVEK